MSEYTFDPEVVEKYKKAGSLAAQALQFGAKMIKKDALLFDVAEKVEEFILKNGGQIAFPCNISRNDAAAHYTPSPGDETRFGDDIVKLDVGTHIDGYAGDNALTVDLTQSHKELLKASREALGNVTKILQIGTTLGEIGKTVEDTMQSHGFEPIRNLSGHQIAQYVLHAGLSVPNYDTNDPTELKKGMFIAIEPFATSGKNGMIKERPPAEIYSIQGRKPIRSLISREVLKAAQEFKTLPFASRWVAKKVPLNKLNYGFRDLVANGILHAYPPLVDVDGGLISQAEHTFMIDDKVTVLTRISNE